MATDITPEAIGFLSAIGVFVVLLAVLLLFINKKLCSENLRGHPYPEQRGKRKHSRDKTGGHTGTVNSFGDDEEPSTSSESDEDVTKQFKISVSRSQSFRSGVSEKGKTTELEQKIKCKRLLCTHQEDSAEGSACEGIHCSALHCRQGQVNDLDRTSQLSYSEILSYEDRPISILPQSPFESRNVRHHGPCRPEMGMVRSLGRPCADGVLETETAFEQDGTSLQVPHRLLEPISKCGDLDVIFEYRAVTQKLTVTIVRAQGLPDKDRSGVNSWQVHIVLLPSKKQRGKTNIQRGPNPVFKEKVTFTKLEPRDVASCAVRFRLYAARTLR